MMLGKPLFTGESSWGQMYAPWQMNTVKVLTVYVTVRWFPCFILFPSTASPTDLQGDCSSIGHTFFG